jgi:hypothetical protein
MTGIMEFISAHQVTASLVGYYVLSAAIGSMPMPDSTSGKGYRWAFQFLNTLSANISRAWASKLPQPVDQPKQP